MVNVHLKFSFPGATGGEASILISAPSPSLSSELLFPLRLSLFLENLIFTTDCPYAMAVCPVLHVRVRIVR